MWWLRVHTVKVLMKGECWRRDENQQTVNGDIGPAQSIILHMIKNATECRMFALHRIMLLYIKILLKKEIQHSEV